jgi:hypothetical protein
MPAIEEPPRSLSNSHEGNLSELRDPEGFEYNEARLQELVDEAYEQVDAGGSRLLASADSGVDRAVASMGMEKTKTESIFTDGFSTRINGIKMRVAALVEETRKRVGALTGTSVANTKQEGKKEAVIEDGQANVPGGMTLDRYMAEHRSSGIDLLKDKARLVQLKLKGVESPERMLGLIHYLEESAVSSDTQSVVVKPSEKEKKMKTYERQGYAVHEMGDYSSGEGGKTIGVVRLLATKDVPFAFDMRDAQKVSELLRGRTDPVELFEGLCGLGYQMTELDLLEPSAIKKFLDDPEAMPFLEKLEAAKGSVSIISRGLFDNKGGGNKILEIAHLDSKENLLSEEGISRLNAVAEIVGHPVSVDSLERWSKIAADPDVVQLLAVARENHEYTSVGEEDVLGNLEKFQNANIAKEIVGLVKKGFEPSDFGLDHLDWHSSGSSIEEIATSVRAIEDKPGFAEFIAQAAEIVGVKPSIKPDRLKPLTICFSRPKEALDVLRFLKKNELLDDVWSNPEYYLNKLFENSLAVETLADPEFSKFIYTMKEAGLTTELPELLFDKGGENLPFYIFNDQDLKRLITDKKNVKLAKDSNLLNYRSLDSLRWGVSTLKKLSEIPDITSRIETLKEYFGDFPKYGVDVDRWCNALEDSEVMEMLTRPEARALLNLLKQAECRLRIDDIFTLDQWASDRGFVGRLSNPETIKYIKEESLGKDLSELRSFVDLDISTRPEMGRFLDVLKQVYYRFRTEDIARLDEWSSDQQLLERLSDPETIEFVKKNAPQGDLPEIKYFVDMDPAQREMATILVAEFGEQRSNLSLPLFRRLLPKLIEAPEIIQAARALEARDIYLSPVHFFEKLKIIGERGLVDLYAQCEGRPAIQKFIIEGELHDIGPNSTLEDVFAEYLKGGEQKNFRENQIFRGEIVGMFLKNGEYERLSSLAGRDAESKEATSAAVEKIKEFASAYNVGGKGNTVATLLAMREYREGEGIAQLLGRTGDAVETYRNLIDRHSAKNIPEGLRVSIGMEYEITKSTAVGYSESNNRRDLSEDMDMVAGFAGVGKGKDAVFEIATKPTDDPHLMLLEMQLLQELGFIDLNFKKEGYEKGARGYHMTIGGESGIEISHNANFLQNVLVMSGWGGINAGHEVKKLSRGRSLNIRQRGAYDTQRVFSNTRPAVEFRALSLDSWEPFERAVESAYYGALAIQAFEKYIPKISREALSELSSDTLEGFLEELKDKKLITESPSDERTAQMIFEWAKLQKGILSDIADHNENFLENETTGYLDDRGRWVDAEDFGGGANRARFDSVAGGAQGFGSYKERMHINPTDLFKEATPEFANSLTSITNLFIKPSQESGGDVVNASSVLDTTKIGRIAEAEDSQARYKSFFDVSGKGREGYYYIQGGSEKMILHKAQVRLLEFKKSMEKILS